MSGVNWPEDYGIQYSGLLEAVQLNITGTALETVVILQRIALSSLLK